MSRACVYAERGPDGGWRPVGVFQATPYRLDAKFLPGDAARLTFAQAMLDGASRERRTGQSLEDWIGSAIVAFSNGMSTWCHEVEPEITAEQTYQREVLGIRPRSITPATLQPTRILPELGGYIAVGRRG